MILDISANRRTELECFFYCHLPGQSAPGRGRKKIIDKSKFSTKLLGNLGYTRSTNSGHRSETKFVKTFY